MKKVWGRLTTTLIFLLTVSSTAVASSLFDHIYFFGDSLTDMGNNTADNAPITNGGSTWANYFAQTFGGQATASNNGGNDYAYAGAQTGDLNSQYSQYLATHQSVDPNALYTVWAGANDINDNLGHEPPQIIVSNGVNNTNSLVQELHAAGANYIMVFNLPDLGKTPAGEFYGPVVSGILTTVTQGYNRALESTLANDGFDVIPVDVFTLFNDLVAHPSNFGLTNIDDFFYFPPGVSSQYVEHPSGYGHLMIAQYALSIITGPIETSLLAETPFETMSAQNASSENQLYNIRSGLAQLGVGQTTIFHNDNGVIYHGPDSDDNVGFAARSLSGTLGFIHRFNENFMLGASISHSYGPVRYSYDLGGFNNKEEIASLLGSLQFNKFYFDGMINYGVIDDSSITRNIAIGISQNATRGRTSGMQAGLHSIFGYNIIDSNNLQTGPFFEGDSQYVHIDAFSETGSIPGIAEQYDAQTNLSAVSGLGWQIGNTFTLNGTPIMPFAKLSYNHQWLDKDREIGASLVSEPDIHFSIPSSGPMGKNYLLSTVGISTRVAKVISLGLGYNSTLFAHGAHVQNVNVNFAVNI